MRWGVPSLVVALVRAGERVAFLVAAFCSDVAVAICKFRLGYRSVCKAQASVC
jgi:hypothetical protein